jgi:hypothetical protein
MRHKLWGKRRAEKNVRGQIEPSESANRAASNHLQVARYPTQAPFGRIVGHTTLCKIRWNLMLCSSYHSKTA